MLCLQCRYLLEKGGPDMVPHIKLIRHCDRLATTGLVQRYKIQRISHTCWFVKVPSFYVIYGMRPSITCPLFFHLVWIIFSYLLASHLLSITVKTKKPCFLLLDFFNSASQRIKLFSLILNGIRNSMNSPFSSQNFCHLFNLN